MRQMTSIQDDYVRPLLAGVIILFSTPYGSHANAPATSPETQEKRLVVLSEALRNSNSFKVRCTAAVALGRLGTAGAVEALIYSMQVDQHYAVRGASAKSLGRVQHKNAVGPLLGQLNDEETLVRNAAEASLRQFHSAEYLSEFEAGLEYPNPVIRRAAVEAFSSILSSGDIRAGRVVLQASSDSDTIIASQSKATLSELSDDILHPILINGLSDDSSDVRRAAALLLAQQSTPLAVKPLTQALLRTGEQEHVYSAVKKGLLQHKEFMDLTALREQSSSTDDQEERIQSIRLLGVLKDTQALRLVRAALKDQSTEVRVAAARAAIDSQNSNLVDSLRAAIETEQDPRVRRHMTLMLKTAKR